MATTSIQNEMASYSVRHRAICESNAYKGPWRKNVDQAVDDAMKHMWQGSATLNMRIVTEQTISMKFPG
jgi:hypothetical protein